MYINRLLEKHLENYLFKNKAIVIYGPRRVGKSTLLKNWLAKIKKRYLFLNCDEGDVLRLLNEADTSTKLKEIIGNYPLIIIDEAQRIKNIGIKLKLIVDNFPNQQIIATGSSSFELSNEIIEPMTGRAFEFFLSPFSLKEIANHQKLDKLFLKRKLEDFLIYGFYPEVNLSSNVFEKQIVAKEIAHNYLYKDVLKFSSLRASEIVQKLLQALALQVGSEVSYGELAKTLAIDYQTVRNYINILEKTFVIFRIPPLTRNLRKEIRKSRKIYFWDNGIRNALINNFNSLSLREDVGKLWENFIVSEFRKQEKFVFPQSNYYFWRTYEDQEIDLIQEEGGRFFAFEIKWQKPKKAPPKPWRENYPNSSFLSITQDNFLEVLKI